MGRAVACAIGGVGWILSSLALAAPPASRFAEILREMHPGYQSFVREVRGGRTRLHPQGLSAGLVRPGGSDPRDPGHAPLAGAGARNDIIVYDDTFGSASSEAWQRLIVDHEYFHALHLGQGTDAPAVDFGDAIANRHYYEALAWGYNLERIEQSRYPGLSGRERRLAEARYAEHSIEFERWLRRDHEEAWRHYGRFFEPRGRTSAR